MSIDVSIVSGSSEFLQIIPSAEKAVDVKRGHAFEAEENGVSTDEALYAETVISLEGIEEADVNLVGARGTIG